MKNGLWIFLFLLLGVACQEVETPLYGAWKVVEVNETALTESKDRFLYTLLHDADKESAIFYFDVSNIEFPLGFKRLSSLSYEDNFMPYKLIDDQLELEDEGKIYRYAIKRESELKLSLMKGNTVIAQLEYQGAAFRSVANQRISFRMVDDFVDYRLELDRNGKGILYRKGLENDTLQGQWTEAEHSYLMELISRLDWEGVKEKYNPLASDVTEYELTIFMEGDRQKVIRSNGYRPAPAIPFELQAVLMNLDKKMRQKSW